MIFLICIFQFIKLEENNDIDLTYFINFININEKLYWYGTKHAALRIIGSNV